MVDLQEGAGGDPLSALTAKLGAVMEARRLLAPHMQPNSAVADRSRLRDILFLDLALEVRPLPLLSSLRFVSQSNSRWMGHGRLLRGRPKPLALGHA